MQSKFHHIVFICHLLFNIILGLLVIFSLVGSLFRPGLLPLAILIVVTLAWVSKMILDQMFISIAILRSVGIKQDDTDKTE